MKRVIASAVGLLFACPLSLVAQERCDAPLRIAPGTIEGSTAGLAASGRSLCGDSAASPAAWFEFVAETDCSVRIETCGSEFDTILSVQRGCDDSATAIECSDDDCGFQSRLVFNADASVSYLIRLSGYRREAGAYRLALSSSERGLGDGCVDAIDVVPGVYHGDTRGMSNDGKTDCGRSGNSPDVWFRYRAERDCFLLASSCGSGFDTTLSIHTECPGNLWNELTCNDDSCGLQSTVSLAARAGETYLLRLSGFEGRAGPYTLELSCGEAPQGDGPDLVVGDFDDLRQVARIGDEFAISVRTVLCNAGSAPVEWFGIPSSNHPFLVFNVYRLLDDRVEQIGQSWVKHGISSSQDNSCTQGCIPFGSYQHLGVGCADIYSASTNADRTSMGPRYEVNPWSGEFEYDGSFIEANEGARHDELALRLRLHDDDVDPQRNSGARYFFETFVFSHDDADRTNSLGFKSMALSGEPGGEWSLDLIDPQVEDGPACVAWPETIQTTLGAGAGAGESGDEASGDDGRSIVLAKATDNGDGTWHYEYALFNMDMHRGVGSFSVPVGPGTEVRNAGFHAPRHHDDGVSNLAWSVSRDASSITWSTEPFAVNPMANAVRWGTLYNFRFDATSPPVESTITLGVFAPSDRPDHDGVSVGPAFESAPSFRRGDSDGSGRIEVTDAIFTLDFLFRGRSGLACLNAADTNDSGRIDLNDGITLLRWLFNNASGIEVLDATCQPDLTPSMAIDATCHYPGCAE